MKSGSATKVLLELLLEETDLEQGLREYSHLCERYHENAAFMGEIVSTGGKALGAGGRILYLCTDTYGMIGLQDAAECPPTFGAEPEQVTAFVTVGSDLPLPKKMLNERNLRAFNQQVLPQLGERDLVLLIDLDGEGGFDTNLKTAVRAGKAQLIELGPHIPPITALETTMGPMEANRNERFRELMMKWMLNAVTTGAFIAAGKVYGNRMIDLRISNLKLWDRSIGIVADIAGVSPKQAESLLKSVVGGAEPDLKHAPKTWVSMAARQSKVVPTAILMGRKGIGAQAAGDVLTEHPKIRDALKT